MKKNRNKRIFILAKNKKKLKLYFIVLTLIITIICSIFFLWRQITASQIASRIHCSPSWDAIGDYFVEKIKPGMKRDEVHQVLEEIGPWYIFYADATTQGALDSDTRQLLFREMVRFNDKMTYLSLGDWDFLYNEDGILIRYEYMDYY
jgi:hypothetical protein